MKTEFVQSCRLIKVFYAEGPFSCNTNHILTKHDNKMVMK